MGYRGRLIFPMEAEILRLDTLATSVNGPGGQGFDPLFKEPLKEADGTTSRLFKAAKWVPCQVETEGDQFDQLSMLNTGDDGGTELILVLHFQDLEDFGWVDSKGRAVIPKGSKLGRIRDQDLEELDDYVDRDLVVTQARPHSYGLSGGKRNLLIVFFARRERSVGET